MNIITFNGSYIPGYKAGGPIRSIENLAFYLKSEINFLIVTNDRDVDEIEPYKNIKVDKWNDIGIEKVYYKSPNKNLMCNMYKILNDTNHDVVLLNGIFSEYTIRYLFLRLLNKVPNKRIFLMPRGDLANGALSLKSKKKKWFLYLANKIGMYKKISYIATSKEEKKAIEQIFNDEICHFVSNLPSKKLLTSSVNYLDKNINFLKIIYISRITPVKNLKFSLEILKNIESNITFDIFGPVYDSDYWNECLEMIEEMPKNIKINYFGEIDNKMVASKIKEYHLLFLPTLGENYGHVIVESLMNSTPVLISDKTPWKDLEKNQAGWSLPLNSKEEFIETILKLTNLDQESYSVYRENSRKYILDKQKPDEIKEDYKKIFLVK